MSAHLSSTATIPEAGAIPRHVAIIMDGNGRWAKQRFLPRVAGHKRGLEAVRATVKACVERGVDYLTLFAFSSENWRRPQDEVKFLMQLFVAALEQEIEKLHAHGVRFRVVGDLTRFEPRIVRLVADAEALTAANAKLQLTIAANYGGRWDIAQAARAVATEVAAGRLALDAIDEHSLAPYLALHDLPAPDLFIRTGGDHRISNFLLWQLAYCELYFTDTLWPDFDAAALRAAIADFGRRERRFGMTSAQIAAAEVPS